MRRLSEVLLVEFCVPWLSPVFASRIAEFDIIVNVLLNRYTGSNQQIYIEYAGPSDVDTLMDNLVNYINSYPPDNIDLEIAANIYARVHMGFVHILPFYDGNGRMARLIANLFLLKAGLPPLVINQSMRQQYITCLADYQLAIGKLNKGKGVWPDEDRLKEFSAFCQSAYAETKKLIQIAVNKQ